MEPPKPSVRGPSLYERLGGEAAIGAMVDDAIVNITVDRRINQRFTNTSGPSLKKNLVGLICARTGGPCTYTGRNMADAHEGMFVRDDEFDALVEDMTRSMDKFKVPAREKAEVMVILARLKNSIVGH